MKNALFIIFLVVGLFVSNAFAGKGGCNQNIEFTCNTTYNLNSGKEVAGPINSGFVYDEEPENYEPSSCIAKVELLTALGTIKALYTQDRGTVYATLTSNDGSIKELSTADQAVPFKTTVLAEKNYQNIESLDLNCLIYRD